MSVGKIEIKPIGAVLDPASSLVESISRLRRMTKIPLRGEDREAMAEAVEQTTAQIRGVMRKAVLLRREIVRARAEANLI